MTFCNRTPWAATVSDFTSQQSFIFQRLRLSTRSNCRDDLQARQREFPMPSCVYKPTPEQLTSHVCGIEYALSASAEGHRSTTDEDRHHQRHRQRPSGLSAAA